MARSGYVWALKRLVGWLTVEAVIPRVPVRSAPGGIGIVKLDAIGDFIVWQRVGRHIRSSYPGQRTVLVASSAWAGLAARMPYWDEVIAIDIPRLLNDSRYRLQTLWRLRRENFTVAIQPTFSRFPFVGDSVIRATAAEQRIAPVGDSTNTSAWQKRIADRLYTRLVPEAPGKSTEFARNEHFLRELGVLGDAKPSGPLPSFGVLPENLRTAQPYFIVFPGAAWSGRQWPEAAFARVIDAVSKTYGLTAVLCGSPAEKALCERIAALASTAPRNLAGQTSIVEFCEVVRGAQLLVGNETSAVHIAAAVETPSVCILGGGHFDRFMPYPPGVSDFAPEPAYERLPCFGCDWRCHLPHREGGPMPCIVGIGHDNVMSAVARAMTR